MVSSIEKRLQSPVGAALRAFHVNEHNKGIHRMRKSLLALLLLAAVGVCVGFVASVMVTVTASDGELNDSKTFTVSVTV